MFNNSINFEKFPCRLTIMEFSVDDRFYFPEKDYLCVSSVDDEKHMRSLIDIFCTHNQSIYCFEDAIIMPKKTWMKVFQPTINDIKEFNQKIDNTPNNWTRSDDYQWVKKVGKNQYEFYQIQEDIPEIFSVFHDTVDTSDYIGPEIKDDDSFIHHAINAIYAYGYGDNIMNIDELTNREVLTLLIDRLKSIYKDNYEQIIAEMLFETYCCSCADKIFNEESEAVSYVLNKLTEV